MATITKAGNIFIEGLACAAIAPVISVVFRFIEGRDGRAEAIESPEDVGEILGEFAKRSAGMARDMERLSKAIGDSAERYQGAAARVTTALEALATDIQSKGKTVADQLSQLETKTQGFGDAMARASDELRKVGGDSASAFKGITDSISALRKQVDEFTEKMRTGGTLLDGLRDLIASVTRFIRPESDRDSKSP
jgi:methyl-accepting chemotaxis protein